MSAFTTALAAATELPKGPPCSVRSTLDSMDTESRSDLAAALADPAVPSSSISRALSAIGPKVSGQTISRHRRSICSCTP